MLGKFLLFSVFATAGWKLVVVEVSKAVEHDGKLPAQSS